MKDTLQDQSMSNLLTDANISYVTDKIQELRRRILDLSICNPLVNVNLSSKSTIFIRFIDDFPNVIQEKLSQGRVMQVVALPDLEDKLPDEQTDEFIAELSNACKEDIEYLEEIKKIDAGSDDDNQQHNKAKRALKDRIRKNLGLPSRHINHLKQPELLQEHARLHGINPDYILPIPENNQEDDHYTNNKIRTLMLPDKFLRTAKSIFEKSHSFERETGINVLHAVFGILEWKHPQRSKSIVSPLLLLEIRMERKQSPKGTVFHVQGTSKITVNSSLIEKLRSDYGLSLPEYEGNDVEEYFRSVTTLLKDKTWKLRREAGLGIFRSTPIAMYHDLDPEKRSLSKDKNVVSLLASTGSGDCGYAENYNSDNSDAARKVPWVVMDADTSQYSVLVDAASSKNLAIEGPPGSGKSQTIVNLIACAIADGKKVLFVAEKLAALDVVRNRLDAIGLGNFILPLQPAGPGRTDTVYESINARLEMNNRKKPVYHDFNERMAELQKNRATLQGYLDVVSSSFGSTGLTIYQVIGHAIKTAENIESLPKNLRRLKIPNVESMNRTKVDTLVSDLDIFGSKLDQLIHMPILWRQSAVKDISRNSAEDHIETAGEIAALLRQLEVDIATSAISPLILPDPFKVDIDHLKNIFSQFTCEKNRLDIKIIGKLIEPKNLYRVRDLAAKIAMRQKLIEQLRQDLHAPEDENISTELAAVAEFAKSQDSRLDPALHDNRIVKMKQEFSNLQSIAKAVEKLPQVWISANWNLAEISKASQRIAAQPTHILGLRHADPHSEVRKVMLEIKAMKSRLDTELQNIRKFLPTPNDSLEPDRLRQQASTLDNPGLLDYVNGIYWAARNTYTNVLGGYRGDHRTKMAHHMREYANWLDACREFGLNRRYCDYFGPYFKGLKTKMGSIMDIVKFHDLCAEIADSNLEIKTCLESSDLASIVDFSRIKNIPNMKYQDLVDEISTLEQTIVKEKTLR